VSACYLNLQWVGTKIPFLTADLEARAAPLPVMFSGGDRGKHPRGGGSSHDGRQPLSRRARMDTAPSRASSLPRWGFTLCWRLPVLASYHSIDLHLLIAVGLLLQTRWQCRCWPTMQSSFLPGRGSWIARMVSSPCGRMDWWLLSAP
jgi:hypothetical protein